MRRLQREDATTTVPGRLFESARPLRSRRQPGLMGCAATTLVCVLLLGLGSGCAPVADPGGPRRLRMGHVYEIKSPTHAFGAAHLNARLQEANVGLELAVFPSAQLGNESELLEQLVAGEIDLVIAGPSFLAMWHPPLGVFDAAYAFEDLEHMLRVADGPLMAPHWEELRRRFGIRVLGTWAYGARHLTGNRPIRHPDDLSGFRLRLPGAAVWQASGKALGASPMPIAFSEVYMALQQGIADGQENPVPVIHAMGFHEVQQYLSLTGHIQSSIQLLINERVWRGLTDPQQEALQQAVIGLGGDVLDGTRRQEAELLEQWRTDGTMQVIDDVDVAAFEQRARQFFSDGFPFSSLYREIASDRRPPRSAAVDSAGRTKAFSLMLEAAVDTRPEALSELAPSLPKSRRSSRPISRIDFRRLLGGEGWGEGASTPSEIPPHPIPLPQEFGPSQKEWNGFLSEFSGERGPLF